jgi:hypothetical protein
MLTNEYLRAKARQLRDTAAKLTDRFERRRLLEIADQLEIWAAESDTTATAEVPPRKERRH